VTNFVRVVEQLAIIFVKLKDLTFWIYFALIPARHLGKIRRDWNNGVSQFSFTVTLLITLKNKNTEEVALCDHFGPDEK
jgi:hypothetical protein